MKIKKSNGFTLLELMVVSAIVGILAVIAVPNFLNYQCKSKQGEAKAILGSMAKEEEAYFSEFGRYGEKDMLNFEIRGESNRYTYEVQTYTEPHGFQITATTMAPGIKTGVGDDVWTISQDMILTQKTNACK